MRKIILAIMVIGMLMVACGEAMTPVSTATVPPPSVTPAPSPVLINEIKLETQTGTAYTLAWSSDETQFATVNGFRNPMITLWDWDNANAELIRAGQIQAGTDQYGAAWSPDGKMLATLAGDSKSVFLIWDTSSWKEIRKFDLPYTNPRRALNWSTDSSTLYGAGDLNEQITIFFALNITDGTVKELGKFPIAQAEVFAISPNADRFAVADPRGVVLIVDAASGEQLTGIKSVDQPVDLAWNPNGMTLAILSYEGTLQLWEILR